MWLRRRRALVYHMAAATRAITTIAPIIPPTMGPTGGFDFEAAVIGARGEPGGDPVEVATVLLADWVRLDVDRLDVEVAVDAADDPESVVL